MTISALFRRKSEHAHAAPAPVTPSPTPVEVVKSAPQGLPTPASNTNVPAAQIAPATGGFAELGLRAELVRAVHEHGYTVPTPIQTQAIPIVLTGSDVLGGAQTGTGKTAGFVLPMLQRLLAANSQKRSKAPRALVLTPTRELAAQVEESVRVYGKHVPISSTVIYGGVGMAPQVAALRKGVDIVVATPGRLLDHVGEKTLDLSQVEIFVLDEADRMLDMGFIHDIKRVMALLPSKRQNLLFSATFSDEIKALADRLLNTPRLIEVARRNSTIEIVEQSVVMAEKGQKAKLLQRLIQERKWFQVLVFTRTKHGANRLAEQLSKNDIPSLAIHGNKSQGARTKALAEFKSGTLQVLVATDIAARGIDIDQLPHVVNFELPNVPEDYVHRIGRTGRAGASGEALSLVAKDELQFLRDIERFTKQKIPLVQIEGFVAARPDPNAPDEINDRPPMPPGQRRGGGGRGQPNAHQQKRGDNTRVANQKRNDKIAAVAPRPAGAPKPASNAPRPASGATRPAASTAKPAQSGLPPARTPDFGVASPSKNFNTGNRNTQRGRTR